MDSLDLDELWTSIRNRVRLPCSSINNPCVIRLDQSPRFGRYDPLILVDTLPCWFHIIRECKRFAIDNFCNRELNVITPAWVIDKDAT